jgi:predicted DNA-binding protein (UPF0278 family)
MGLLWDLLIGVPATLSREILKEIKKEIDQELLLSEESIKRRLQELQIMVENGEISEEEYEELEGELIKRLRVLRERG